MDSLIVGSQLDEKLLQNTKSPGVVAQNTGCVPVNPKPGTLPGPLRRWDSSEESRGGNSICSSYLLHYPDVDTGAENPQIALKAKPESASHVICSNEARLELEDNEELFLQTLDAVYNAIVHPERLQCEPLDVLAADIFGPKDNEEPEDLKRSRVSRSSEWMLPTARSRNATYYQECCQPFGRSNRSLNAPLPDKPLTGNFCRNRGS